MLLKTGKTLPLLLVFCRCNFHLVTLGPECSQQGFCWWTPPGLQNPELTALLEAKFHIFNFWKFKRGTILVKRKRFWQPEWFRKCLFHCWVLSDVVQVVFKFYFSIISFLKIKKKNIHETSLLYWCWAGDRKLQWQLTLPCLSGFHITAKQNQEKYLRSGRCNSNKKSLVLDAYWVPGIISLLQTRELWLGGRVDHVVNKRRDQHLKICMARVSSSLPSTHFLQ